MKARRAWSWPLVPAYWAGLRLKDGLRSAGVLPVRRLGWPVVSVGSISAGGAGKTPVVIALAELLAARGWAADVLSRGYGREGTEVAQVDPTLPDAATKFGDEPVLIAQRTGRPVWVGAERFVAGEEAERAAAGQERGVHLLDDGFQHRQLARAVDVVLVTAEDLEEALLPAGNRREPLSALRRADAVVVREDEADRVAASLPSLMRPEVPVWIVRRRLVVDRGEKMVAFCGIARPEGFFSMLRGAGVSLSAEITFPDHHTYTIGDVSRLADSCHLGCGGFVTTEKDAVKMGPEFRAQLERVGRLQVARLEAEFANPEAIVRALEARLG